MPEQKHEEFNLKFQTFSNKEYLNHQTIKLYEQAVQGIINATRKDELGEENPGEPLQQTMAVLYWYVVVPRYDHLKSLKREELAEDAPNKEKIKHIDVLLQDGSHLKSYTKIKTSQLMELLAAMAKYLYILGVLRTEKRIVEDDTVSIEQLEDSNPV